MTAEKSTTSHAPVHFSVEHSHNLIDSSIRHFLVFEDGLMLGLDLLGHVNFVFGN